MNSDINIDNNATRSGVIRSHKTWSPHNNEGIHTKSPHSIPLDEDETGPAVYPDNDEELRALAKDWNNAEWEQYLASTETPLREQITSDPDIVSRLTSDDYAAALADTSEYGPLDDRCKVEVRKALKTLTDRQRQIIHMRYWEDQTLKAIAERLGMRFQNVHKSLKLCHKKIEAALRRQIAREEIEKILGLKGRSQGEQV